jgi:hypothetical protein
LTVAGGETKLPVLFTQFKGHKQDTLSCAIMAVVGCWGCHGLPPPWWDGFLAVLFMEKKHTNRGPFMELTCKYSIYPLQGAIHAKGAQEIDLGGRTLHIQ